MVLLLSDPALDRLVEPRLLGEAALFIFRSPDNPLPAGLLPPAGRCRRGGFAAMHRASVAIPATISGVARYGGSLGRLHLLARVHLVSGSALGGVSGVVVVVVVLLFEDAHGLLLP